MRLDKLLSSDLPQAAAELEIRGLASDSRKVLPGYLFVALNGTRQNGHRYIADALARGAIAVVQEGPNPHVECPPNAPPVITLAGARQSLALMARRFFRYAPKRITAVTGTNGKTSVVEFLRQIWTHSGRAAASLGTLGVRGTRHDQLFALEHTTPEPVLLHHVLRDLYALGIEDLALEASSHALTQARLDGVEFSLAGFTNLSREHLDYHGNLESYRAAKQYLFARLLPARARAVINVADEEGKALAARLRRAKKEVITVGGASSQLSLARQTPCAGGWDLKLSWEGRSYEVFLPLVGDFQTENVMLALGLALASGVPAARALAALSHLVAPPGRMEWVGITAAGADVYVDYAHTPDALRRVLAGLLASGRKEIVLVFGCGGNRDQGKRSEMGRIAEEMATWVVLADDNPRTESPALIREQILAGTRQRDRIANVGDRQRAIGAALERASSGQVVVLAGKGHESGQEIKGELRPFNDKTTAQRLILDGGGKIGREAVRAPDRAAQSEAHREADNAG